MVDLHEWHRNLTLYSENVLVAFSTMQNTTRNMFELSAQTESILKSKDLSYIVTTDLDDGSAQSAGRGSFYLTCVSCLWIVSPIFSLPFMRWPAQHPAVTRLVATDKHHNMWFDLSKGHENYIGGKWDITFSAFSRHSYQEWLTMSSGVEWD